MFLIFGVKPSNLVKVFLTPLCDAKIRVPGIQ